MEPHLYLFSYLFTFIYLSFLVISTPNMGLKLAIPDSGRHCKRPLFLNPKGLAQCLQSDATCCMDDRGDHRALQERGEDQIP